jgi:hypothetical protein
MIISRLPDIQPEATLKRWLKSFASENIIQLSKPFTFEKYKALPGPFEWPDE